MNALPSGFDAVLPVFGPPDFGLVLVGNARSSRESNLAFNLVAQPLRVSQTEPLKCFAVVDVDIACIDYRTAIYVTRAEMQTCRFKHPPAIKNPCTDHHVGVHDFAVAHNTFYSYLFLRLVRFTNWSHDDECVVK